MRTTLITFLTIFCSVAWGQSQNPVWRHLPTSTYSAKLVGMASTNTEGQTVYGTYDSDQQSHKFPVVYTGWYYMYVDPTGGSTYSLDSDWGARYVPGADARSFTWMPDSAMTITNVQRLFTSAAKALLAGHGVGATYLPNEVSIKLSPSDSTYKVINPYGEMDTLTVNSATPTVAYYSYWREANTSSTGITDFTGAPTGTERKVVYIEITTAYTTFVHGTIDCGGVTLAPQAGDIMRCVWNGTEWKVRFDYIN